MCGGSPGKQALAHWREIFLEKEQKRKAFLKKRCKKSASTRHWVMRSFCVPWRGVMGQKDPFNRKPYPWE